MCSQVLNLLKSATITIFLQLFPPPSSHSPHSRTCRVLKSASGLILIGGFGDLTTRLGKSASKYRLLREAFTAYDPFAQTNRSRLNV